MTDYRSVYEEHRDFLWGYCYRLTGSAADAEDLVQEAFVRAMERPPDDTDRPWRPWLVRVATNLRRDAWRRQKVRAYQGPWLPSPIETGGPWAAPAAAGLDDVEGRYETLESISFAFLLALEALTPRQRAVLLLRDVYDYSLQETAAALGLSVANVKTTLHRARRAMAAYDRRRRPPTEARARATRAALERFLACFLEADPKAMEQLLADEVQSIHDAGGEFLAAGVPVVGREKVALFYSNIVPPKDERLVTEFRTLNGLPGILTERPQAPDGLAPRWAYTIEVDDEGRITRSYAVLASRKLIALRFPGTVLMEGAVTSRGET